jgi:hypothetical protein
MKPLVIKVEDVESADTWVYVLDDSPVVLGRGDGATLRIGRPFVSQAHGTFTHDGDADAWTYMDLDSASGTAGADGPLTPEQAVTLAPGASLVIGSLVLTVLAEGPSEPPPAGADSPFAVTPRAEGETAPATVRLSAVAAALRRAHGPQPPAAEDDSPRGTMRLPDGWNAAPVAGVVAGGTRLFPEGLPPPSRPRRALAQRPLLGAAGKARARATLGIAVAVASAATAGALVAWRLVASGDGDGAAAARVEPAPARAPGPPRPLEAPAAVPGGAGAAVAAGSRIPAVAHLRPDCAPPQPLPAARAANGARGEHARDNRDRVGGERAPHPAEPTPAGGHAHVANRAMILE